ncbi:MAG: hypothetical protein ACOYMD_07925 [Paludibacter sp.]
MFLHFVRSLNFLLSAVLFVFSGMFFSCKVNEPDTQSAYIANIFEYVYAPGQHASIAKSTDISNFIGEPKSDKGWLYLGGFGGFVVAGFDHNVTNGSGADFEVYALAGASPEPAVVYVMEDANNDGKPNEIWYELKGNQFENSKRNYWLRYYKASSTTSNISWKDAEGNQGELIAYNNTSVTWWWPASSSDSITFYGTRLPDSYENHPVNEVNHWTVPSEKFNWGYAENNYGADYFSEKGSNQLDISNAIDEFGNKVNLSTIKFIKIQTGVFQQAGWLNEVSSEVRGAKDLDY